MRDKVDWRNDLCSVSTNGALWQVRISKCFTVRPELNQCWAVHETTSVHAYNTDPIRKRLMAAYGLKLMDRGACIDDSNTNPKLAVDMTDCGR